MLLKERIDIALNHPSQPRNAEQIAQVLNCSAQYIRRCVSERVDLIRILNQRTKEQRTALCREVVNKVRNAQQKHNCTIGEACKKVGIVQATYFKYLSQLKALTNAEDL